MTQLDDVHWYAVQTKVHAESQAASHLERQGYTIYLPCYLKKRRHARRVDAVSAPLFPRYLFVGVDRLTQRWRAIQSTVGVAKLVCRGDTPAEMPVGVIAEIKRREDESGFIRLAPAPRFAPGDPVRVEDGVFSGSLGLFEGMSGQERVAILLDLLGRKVRVVLDGESVVAA